MRTLLALTLMLSASAALAADPLDGITIRPECMAPPYDRSLYRHWIDADGDGQSARHEVLIAEADGPVSFKTERQRIVVSGLWHDPYSGMTFTKASDLDIDHLVPLMEAHLSGACHWSYERRRDYANDLDHDNTLIAVHDRLNQQKGAKAPRIGCRRMHPIIASI